MAKVLTLGEPLAVFAAQDADASLVDAANFKKYLAGAELNVAVGLARLGHNVTYLTQVGTDPFGQFIIKAINANGIATDQIRMVNDAWTGFELKQRVTSGDPDTYYFRKGSAAARVTPSILDGLSIQSFDHIHLTGIFSALSQTTLQTVDAVLHLAKSAGVPVTFDPNLRPALWPNENEMKTALNALCEQADIVMPGVNEGMVLMGSSDPENIADFYLHKGVKTVIVKVGAKGAFMKDQKGQTNFVPGFKVKQVIDTVGAGDGFATGVIDGFLKHAEATQILRQGNAIGALAVLQPGDSDGYPTAKGLDAFLQTN